MSITGGLDHKKPSHRRNDSGELDVFEAARYFSGYNDNHSLLATTNLTQKEVSKDEKRGYMREARVSLDVPSLKHYYLHQNKHSINEIQQLQQYHHHHQQQQEQQSSKSKEKKKYKQPSSPGGKIAQFLNSLFSQTNSKKKKPSKSLSSTTTTTAHSMKDDDESLVGRRKRRSSISHFRSTSSAVDARSIYSTSSSGFRTPPPYNLNTPSKSCKDFRSFNEYKDVLATLSKYNIQGNGNSKDENKSRASTNNNNINWVDDHKLRLKNGLVEKSKNLNHGYQEKKEINKFIIHDDNGAESDSSSDLFELQIDCDFGFCSSGLPVYETTHLDNIKRSSSTAITNAPIKA